MNTKYETLNITVLGDISCSTTRTYLFYLKKNGFRVKKLILINFEQSSDVSYKNKFLAKLRNLRSRIFIEISDRQSDAFFHKTCGDLQEEAGLDVIDYASEWNYENYATQIEKFNAEDFEDQKFRLKLIDEADTVFLYTNGGIVPETVLNHRKIKILHVHPGIVPEFRGSDCLLWSLMSGSKIGVSCFYMSPGIDEGVVVGQAEFDKPRLPTVTKLVKSGKEDLAYRALLYAIDPHYRAILFTRIMKKYSQQCLKNLPSEDQANIAIPPYLWMHPRLRTLALKKLST